ncbi:HNH endonuclease [Sphingomonas antarctica]|uniref:hypothetical protein n=1 Tax=Sphingomonas antarctica TaxID=2040274 RepID=UPI0039EB5F67
MTAKELARETRKQRRLEILGTDNPRCGTCGHSRWQAIEKHHPADHGRDDMTAMICRNCHRVLSDDQKDHPAFDPNADAMLDSIGHFLLGLADMLRLVIERLYAFGLALIERAAAPAEGGQ